jgi:hypothetical protein
VLTVAVPVVLGRRRSRANWRRTRWAR